MALRIEHLVVTLTGSAQQLTGLSGSESLRKVSFQPGTGNSNPVYLGGDNTVSATVYGVRLPAPTDSEPPAPYEDGEFSDGAVKLTDYWAFGTNGEKLHLKAIVYLDTRKP